MQTNALYNDEAENFLIAAVLRYPDEYATIVGNLTISSEDFVGVETRKIAKAIDSVVASRKSPTLPYVVGEMKIAGHSDSMDYLARLGSLPCSIDQASGYARTVRGLSVRRQLANSGAKIIEIAREEREVEDALSKAEQALRKITALAPDNERSPNPKEILARMRLAGSGDGIPILFSPTLQAMTGGFRPTELWAIGAFSSTGKSALAANIVLDVIANREKKIALMNIEMSAETYMARMLAVRSGVPLKSIRDKVTIGFEQTEALSKAERFIGNSGLRLFDTTSTLTSIKQEARKLKNREGLDVIIVDYIQSIRGSRGEEVADTREIAIELQAMAKELRVCIIALSQVSNQFAKDDIAAAGAGDYYSFKGHGSVRDNADVALVMRRNRRSQSPLLDIQIAKNRNGELAEFTCWFDLTTGKIVEREQDDEDE